MFCTSLSQFLLVMLTCYMLTGLTIEWHRCSMVAGIAIFYLLFSIEPFCFRHCWYIFWHDTRFMLHEYIIGFFGRIFAQYACVCVIPKDVLTSVMCCWVGVVVCVWLVCVVNVAPQRYTKCSQLLESTILKHPHLLFSLTSQ